ncbi:MAG: hypothetical protein ACLQF1_13375 [Methyloceanibacter sp.]
MALECAQAETAVKITDALGAQAFTGDAHALLMGVYKDHTQPIELCVQAAKAAIGYEKPRLTAVDAKVEGTLDLETLVHMSYETGKQRHE